MSRALPVLKVLLGLTSAGALASVASWFVLLFNICSNPREPIAATLNTIPYGCHGVTVFITPLEQYQLSWNGPVELALMVISFILLAVVIHAHRTRAA